MPEDPGKPLESAGAAAADGLAGEPLTYAAIVRRQFLRNRAAVVGLGIVAMLFAVAILVPFLASSYPYRIRIDGRTHYPLFRNLTPQDLIILAAALCLATWAVVRRLLPARLRRWSLPACLVVFLAACAVIRATVRERNDRTDYRALAVRPGADAIWAPIPYSPQETDLDRKRQPPGRLAGHLLGTDDLGRDVFSRLLWSTRVSLAVGFVAEGFAVAIGVFLGALAGYFGRRTDFVIMRLVEIVVCFPGFFLILTVLAVFGRHLWLIMLMIGLLGWTENARFVRAEFLRLRTMEYAMAARALGLGWARIVFRHLLPNGIAPVMVNASFGVAAAILIEGGLSFLGFGVAPPTATWGTMLNDGMINPVAMPWMIILPGLAIFTAVAAYNLVGEGLRDALDPRLRSA